MDGTAVFDETGAYRYYLTREFLTGEGQLGAVMLNPSTATDTVSDSTIRRWEFFARLWGYRKLAIANIFAFRATKPKDLKKAADPVGPDNDAWILKVAKESRKLVCAWGAHGSYRNRDEEVKLLLAMHETWCFGKTKDGHPLHPLYQPNDAMLVRYHWMEVV